MLLNIHIGIYCNTIKSSSLYNHHGSDWKGICSAGTKQSPINIIKGSNTVDTKNIVDVTYAINDKTLGKKFKFDGDKLFMDIDLGSLRYYAPEKAVEEIYEAYRIEIHYPAEHYITIDNRTPRHELELQIFHKLAKTNNPEETNRNMKVNRAIVSILFTIGEQVEGDMFFNNLGISKYNVDQNYKMNYPKKGAEIDNKLSFPGQYGKGFNYNAVEGLMNLINMDPEMFYYYGSETLPPCREDILWMIFSKPRSMGPKQAQFINHLIAKKQQDPTEAGKLFGNNRRIKLYDTRLRGHILHNRLGLNTVNGKSLFVPQV